MSVLKELLNGIEVEWKALGEVCEFRNGFAFKSKLFKNKGLPIIRITNISDSIVNLKEVKYFDASDYRNINLSNFVVGHMDILIAMSGATTGKVGVYCNDNLSYLNQRVGKFIPNENILNKKFLYYLLLYNTDFIYELAGGGAQPNLSSNMLMTKLRIPIPYPNDPEKSLAIQQEIVRVLDQFTETTNELTAKLANERLARKKQYEFYREQLFSFEEGNVEWKTMGDIGEFVRGNGLQKTDFTETGTGCIHYGQIYTFYGNCAFETRSFVSKELAMKLKKVRTGDLIITNTSENIEDVCKAVAWLGEDEIVTGGHACILKHNQNPKYLVYCTQVSQFYRQKRKLAKGTKVMDVSAKDLAKIKIPIPSLEEQERIVYLLDEFDRLHTAIEEELTNEIALRNQQYEYYREQLLSFSNENK